VTGFAKRGLPHTSDFMDLKDCNFLLIKEYLKIENLKKTE